MVEAVRGIAYVAVVVEAARAKLPAATGHGESKDVFLPVLMDGLMACYVQMFGDFPPLRRKSDQSGEFQFLEDDPAVKWLQHIFYLVDRWFKGRALSETEIGDDDTVALGRRPGNFTHNDQLKRRIEMLIDMKPTTLARHFRDAKVRAKRERESALVAS
jgi:hypothetical protein